MFKISLIAETGSEDKTLEKFKSTFPQMEMVEYRQRYMTNKSSYIYLKLIPQQHSATNLRRGRPLKLTYEQMNEVKEKLADPDCNKSRLAKEYGLTYATILKISKSI